MKNCSLKLHVLTFSVRVSRELLKLEMGSTFFLLPDFGELQCNFLNRSFLVNCFIRCNFIVEHLSLAIRERSELNYTSDITIMFYLLDPGLPLRLSSATQLDVLEEGCNMNFSLYLLVT